jgi:transcriptional regulator with GAF, ATPase, and Fis domain
MKTPHLNQHEVGGLQLCNEVMDSEKVVWRALGYVPNRASTDFTVLRTEENGTDQELIARSIFKLAHRSPRWFVRANCAAIPSLRIAGRAIRRGGEATDLQGRNHVPVASN